MITPRLECIIKHVTQNTVADIGTDHAYVPIRLVLHEICSKVIATDIRRGPAEAAVRHITKYGLCDKIEVRQGAGLSPLAAGETGEIIIAGMGGEMISKILTDHPDTARASLLILQPMNAQYELRRFLYENAYTIYGEDLATEGNKLYNILLVRQGKQERPSEDFFFHVPPCLSENPLYEKLIDKKIREFSKILAGNKKSKAADCTLMEYLIKTLNRLYLEKEKK